MGKEETWPSQPLLLLSDVPLRASLPNLPKYFGRASWPRQAYMQTSCCPGNDHAPLPFFSSCRRLGVRVREPRVGVLTSSPHPRPAPAPVRTDPSPAPPSQLSGRTARPRPRSRWKLPAARWLTRTRGQRLRPCPGSDPLCCLALLALHPALLPGKRNWCRVKCRGEE